MGPDAPQAPLLKIMANSARPDGSSPSSRTPETEELPCLASMDSCGKTYFSAKHGTWSTAQSSLTDISTGVITYDAFESPTKEQSSRSQSPTDDLPEDTKKPATRWPLYGKNIRTSLLREWAITKHELSREFKTRNWKLAFLWFFILAWITLLLAAIIVLPMSTMIISIFDSTACAPDGSFRLTPSSGEMWARSGFFQVTAAFGNYSFTQAKIIDVVWDVLVGRACQFIFMWFTWKVFAAYVAMSMQAQPVTFETFWVVFLGQEANLMTAGRLLHDFTARRRLVSKGAMAFMLLSIIFVTIFPTLAGAMTGYTTNLRAFVPNNKGGLVPYSEFDAVLYIIHDGSRINLTNNYPVIRQRTDWNRNSEYVAFMTRFLDHWELWGDACAVWLDAPNSPVQPSTLEICYLRGNVSNYVKEYGFFGLYNDQTKFNNIDLGSPALNISATYLSKDQPDFGWNWVDPRTNEMPFANQPSEMDGNILMAADNAYYTLQYVTENGICKPQGDYQWGFSVWQAAIMLVLLLMWSLGLCLMWFKARLTLELRGGLEVPGRYKSAVRFARSLQLELINEEKDPDSYTEEELQAMLRGPRKGGAISMIPASPGGTYNIVQGFLGWLNSIRNWAIAWVILVVAFTVFVVYWPMLPRYSPLKMWGNRPEVYMFARIFERCLLSAVVVVLCAVLFGRSSRTRAVYTTVGLIVSSVIIGLTWVFYVLYRF